MDNLFEIIVFFFVIYTILGSIFGKKKTQQKKTQQQYKQPVPQHRRTTTKPVPAQKSSQDILEELFGFKIPKPEEETSYSQPKPHEDLEYQSWDPEKDFQKKIDQKEKYVYRDIEKKIEDINYDKVAALETSQRKSKVSKPIILPAKKEVSKRTVELRKKLKEPVTLRDMFLISEILGKPRAIKKIR